jgi:hypothetical protein
VRFGAIKNRRWGPTRNAHRESDRVIVGFRLPVALTKQTERLT